MRFGLGRESRQRQTLASFDYQWRRLPEGDGMLSDHAFDAKACAIVEEMTGVAAGWFAGKRVLDAGCGSGRWSAALLRLGAKVTAVDASEAGLARTEAACRGLGQIETRRVNLLQLPGSLRARRFDMVFSFGVLHHTGRTFAALENVAELVADNGLIFLYLYGSRSWKFRKRVRTQWLRFHLAGLPFDRKVAVLQDWFPDYDVHQCFDLLSPTINDRLTFDRVAAELARLRFTGMVQTIPSTEILLRAQRPRFSGLDDLRAPLPTGTRGLYWKYLDERAKTRRDAAYERRFWELAARTTRGPLTTPSVAALCARLGIAGEAFRDRKALIVCADSTHPALEVQSLGGRVTVLSPLPRSARNGGSALDMLHASTLDAPSGGDEQYDFVFALGSSVAFSRQPDRAIRCLASRLAPDGILIVQTRRPGHRTVRHQLCRLLLKPFRFERKIEILLRRRPDAGLAEAFASLSPRLPLRLSGEQLGSMLTAVGLETTRLVEDDRDLYARARRS
jgi:SAM-dependent methyltransferase